MPDRLLLDDEVLGERFDDLQVVLADPAVPHDHVHGVSVTFTGPPRPMERAVYKPEFC
ncbi:hypothetical protein [Streptomyces sp. Root1310]|uniref:hypothetical protein n=1 Tax=Streptomyces sp. Root1310 TaxID=1736452 RepID=UPI000ACA1C21